MNRNIKVLVKVVAIISSVLVIGYLGISAIAGDKLSTAVRVFDPKKISVFNSNPEDVKIMTSDGKEIVGWYIKSQKSDKVVILVHGLNSSRTHEFADKFSEFGAEMNRQGFSILMIDLRGHGQSSDSRITFGITERRDVIAAVNWLKQKGFKPQKIGALGVSLGSASVIGAAVEDKDIAAIVTDSGYAEVYPIMQKHWQSASGGLPEIFLPSTMMFGHLFTGYDPTLSKPVQEISRISPRPVLIIHSKIDPYTPIENAYNLKAAYPQAEYWETNAKVHPESFNTNPQAYIAKVTDFFNRSLK
ncbi:X-Pro dipeptidyl-peptidase (S15 family) [Synechococcus sp. PCC 7502]|uniref:alpha/beta hydrolase n=1 Tax=Synechococcus sp. PCC 7502 TaxID=1173263 RepID=UPI00029FA11A|nr:alpha/beta hydrolase [Synechococcus sp. PCC 7502]AFY73513.1 X-Pro dipeptidyl-peptidase (S15 family) [Synechococcus sp. PCC 7502]